MNCVCGTSFQVSTTSAYSPLYYQTQWAFLLQNGSKLFLQMNTNGKRLTEIQKGQINENTLLYGVDPLILEETLSGSSRSYTYSDLVPHLTTDEFEFLTGINTGL